MTLNIIKLVVGAENLEDFSRWQNTHRTHYKGQNACVVRTRYAPRKADEILASGGSIYRVIKGYICCRQKILGFEQVDYGEQGTYCHIIVDPTIIKTQIFPKKAFQGWRYLKQADAPLDAAEANKSSDPMPPELEIELRELGLL